MTRLKSSTSPSDFSGKSRQEDTTLNGIDMIVSWNLKHLVKMKTRTMVNEINHCYGYRGIEICTPKEVLEYGE